MMILIIKLLSMRILYREIIIIKAIIIITKTTRAIITVPIILCEPINIILKIISQLSSHNNGNGRNIDHNGKKVLLALPWSSHR